MALEEKGESSGNVPIRSESWMENLPFHPLLSIYFNFSQKTTPQTFDFIHCRKLKVFFLAIVWEVVYTVKYGKNCEGCKKKKKEQK
ncbi:MAG: hypothetical protein Q4E67_03275 [Planctomycetia bacterium]|nr:hypothetical protein [Planctomycetia bacterium]